MQFGADPGGARTHVGESVTTGCRHGVDIEAAAVIPQRDTNLMHPRTRRGAQRDMGGAGVRDEIGERLEQDHLQIARILQRPTCDFRQGFDRPGQL